MNATPCPAHRYDEPEERVVCIREPSVRGAWGFICRSCWDAMLDAEARRQEWEIDISEGS
jgi:hypothetical protein